MVLRGNLHTPGLIPHTRGGTGSSLFQRAAFGSVRTCEGNRCIVGRVWKEWVLSKGHKVNYDFR